MRQMPRIRTRPHQLIEAGVALGKSLAIAASMALIACGCASIADNGTAANDQHQSTRPQVAERGDAAPAPWKLQIDDWYSLTLGGMRAGWMRLVREDDGSRYRTVREMRMKFQHADISINTHTYVEWIETHAGQPQWLHIAQRSDTPLKDADTNPSVWGETRDGDPSNLLTRDRQWEFHGDSVTKIVPSSGAAGENGETFRTTHPAPKSAWFTPVAAERHIRAQIAENAPVIEFVTLHADEALKLLSVRSSRLGETEFKLSGRRIPVTVWQTQALTEGGQAISHYSSDGKLAYSIGELGIGLLESRLTTKQIAVAKVDAAQPKPVALPELKLDRPLTASTRAAFEIQTTQKTLPQLPSVGAQVVEPMHKSGAGGDDRRDTARIMIDINGTSPASELELSDARLREAAPEFNSHQGLVLELAARAMRQTKGLNNADLAESCRAVVHQHFGQAVMSTETREPAPVSDDTSGIDQARMLSSVLHVHRIGSRLVGGLAYRPLPDGAGRLVWRIWTQALLEGAWTDFDALETSRFSPGHILLETAPFSDPTSAPDPADFADFLSSINLRVISQE